MIKVRASNHSSLIKYIKTRVSKQDVNTDNIYPDDDSDAWKLIKKVLCEFYTDEKINMIAHVSLLNLVSNIIPHRDECFIRLDSLNSTPDLFVLSSGRVKGEHEDTADFNYFFHDGVWEELFAIEYVQRIAFNATKIHAMMIETPMIGFTVWFTKKARKTTV